MLLRSLVRRGRPCAALVAGMAVATTGAITATAGTGADSSAPPLVFVRVYPPETPSALYRTTAGGRARRLALPGGATGPSWSRARAALAFSAGAAGEADLYVSRSDGTRLRRLTSGVGSDIAPAWSPDGSRLAFVRTERVGNRSSIWIVSAVGGAPRRVTRGAIDLQPSWSRDGASIAFLRLRPSTYESSLWTVRADGSGAKRLAADVAGATEPVWSPVARQLLVTDGKALLLVNEGGRIRVVMRLASGARGERRDPQPAWSSDGRWIAFTQPRPSTMGRADVWVVRPDGTGLRRVTRSPGVDTDPSFRD